MRSLRCNGSLILGLTNDTVCSGRLWTGDEGRGWNKERLEGRYGSLNVRRLVVVQVSVRQSRRLRNYCKEVVRTWWERRTMRRVKLGVHTSQKFCVELSSSVRLRV